VTFTLPTGDEEMLPGFPMDFVHRKAVNETKLNEDDEDFQLDPYSF